jgi:hypothetical protein
MRCHSVGCGYTEVPPYIRSSIATGAWATDIASGLKKSHLTVTESVGYVVQKFKANFLSKERVEFGRGVTGNLNLHLERAAPHPT